MYIQITTRCNMKCGHCCYSCTDKGVDMSEETFIKAVTICAESGDGIQIGGGEPTIHPKFWQLLGYAIGHCDSDCGIWLATNGKLTNAALTLAKMAKSGVISVALSQDRWHEPIDSRVVEAFRRGRSSSYGDHSHDYDCREIRDVGSDYNGLSRNPIKAGRWKSSGSTGCVADEFMVKPDGSIRQCGCLRSPVIGHVNGGFERPDHDSCCYRELKKERAA